MWPLVLHPKEKRNVTIVDIAEAAGVSRASVSLVLRSKPGVGLEAKARVEQAMQQLGYVYNRGAANVRQSRSSVVGMIINDLTNPFFAQLAVGIDRALQISGFMPFMANTGESVLRQAALIRSMREHGAAGLIICPALDTDPNELAALAQGFPMVLAVRRIAGSRMATAASENTRGAQAATAHLLSLGHRKIAFLGGRPSTIIYQERVAGYRAALETHGLPFEPSRVIESMPTRQGGMDAMTSALSAGGNATAALCFNDIVAMGAMIAASRHGLQIGKDFAIVGFDDIAEASLVSPALTTIAVNPEVLGENAARLLLNQIREGAGSIGNYIGDARLVVRSSCGAKSAAGGLP